MERVLIGVAILLVALLAFSAWYAAEYSMEPAVALEIGDPSTQDAVLIATQGSAYKDRLVLDLLDHLRKDSLYVRVIDVSELHAIQAEEWKAIVVLHTWEMWKPQPDAAEFQRKYTDHPGLIVLSTSGSGEEKLDPADGISSASVIEQAPHDADRIAARLRALMDP